MKNIQLISLIVIALVSAKGYGQGVSISSTSSPTTTNTSTVASDFTAVGNGTPTSGRYSSLFGYNAGASLTGTHAGCFFGYNSGAANTTADENSFFGIASGQLTTGDLNSFFGASTGAYNTTGHGNTFLGYFAGNANTTGYENVFIGITAGLSFTSGFRNTFLGSGAGFHCDGDDYCTHLGAEADSYTPGLSYATAVGGLSKVEASSSIVLGRVYSATTTPRTYDYVGIGTVAPLTQFHIVLAPNDDVRIENLQSVSGPYQLMVMDANNDVKLTPLISLAENGCSVDANNNVVLGNDAGGTPSSTVLNNREIPLNGYSVGFVDNGVGNGQVGIGGVAPWAKLTCYRPVVGDQPIPYGLYVYNSDVSSIGTQAIGIDINVDNGGNADNIGAHIDVQNATANNVGLSIDVANSPAGNIGENINVTTPAPTSGSTSQGLWATTSGGYTDQAIKGDADAYNTTTSTYGYATWGGIFNANNGTQQNQGVTTNASTPLAFTAQNKGIIAEAEDGDNSTGGWFLADGAITANTAVYATVTGSGSSTDMAAFLDGDVYTTGSYLPSDEHLKSNVKSFDNSLGLLKKLDAKSYTFNTEEYKNSLNLPKGDQIGIMAQNMKSVFPSLVKDMIAPSHTDPKTHKPIGADTKFLGVNYVGLIPVLVAAVKELDAKIADNKALADQVASLQSQLNDICSTGCAGLRGNSTNTDQLENKLLQNVPNPFSLQTTIGYVVNTGTTASMHINGLDGKLIKHIELAKGTGTVTIDGTELSAGTYTYTLYVDGKVIDTKLMVIAAEK